MDDPGQYWGDAGDDLFVFRPHFSQGGPGGVGPTNIVQDFEVGTAAHDDTLDLRGLGFTRVADVLNHTDNAANAGIHAENSPSTPTIGGEIITLQGVTKADLAAHQFDILV